MLAAGKMILHSELVILCLVFQAGASLSSSFNAHPTVLSTGVPRGVNNLILRRIPHLNMRGGSEGPQGFDFRKGMQDLKNDVWKELEEKDGYIEAGLDSDYDSHAEGMV